MLIKVGRVQRLRLITMRATRAVIANQSDPTSDIDNISSEELSEEEYQPNNNWALLSDDTKMSPKRRKGEGDAFGKYLQKMKQGVEDDLKDDDKSDLPEWRENRRKNSSARLSPRSMIHYARKLFKCSIKIVQSFTIL